jgi:FKBP-type peptidyl-prolyl cis-trans isomerase
MMKNVIKSLAIVVLGSIALSSCMSGDDPFNPYEQNQKDIATIDNYLTSNNITNVIKDPTGVRMVIATLGKGLPANVTNTVDVDYTGTLLSNGSQFDKGNVKGQLSGYIDGWKVALTTLPEGSKATLYIPSQYAYGNTAKGSIPANSILVFDVNFKDVVYSSTEVSQFTTDTTAIDAYLASKNINAITDSSGLRYVITSPGSGAKPTWYNKLKLSYTIKLMTDDTKNIVDISQQPSETFYSRVVDYIHGLKIGLQKMSVGSKATFYVPSGYAFGVNGGRNQQNELVVPPNSNLIIDVQLTDIVE